MIREIGMGSCRIKKKVERNLQGWAKEMGLPPPSRLITAPGVAGGDARDRMHIL